MINEKTHRIIEHYNHRALTYGTSGEATLGDANMRALEVETAASWLTHQDRVLDVCCGNGIATVELSGHCQTITGIDLSEKMIEAARRQRESRSPRPQNVTFQVRDVLDPEIPAGEYNAVVSIRGLINLPSWELQQQAIRNIHRLLPVGGKFIFIEGSKDGLRKINRFRKRLGLSPIAEPWYNRHFESARLSAFMDGLFEVQDTRNLDAYFLISRVFYPFACQPDEPDFGHICNTVARLILPYVEAHTGTTLLICNCFVKK